MPDDLNNPVLPPRPNPVGEVWGGFAAMLVTLPSSIAFGLSVYAPLGPDGVTYGVRAGLLGAIALGLGTAAVGGAQRLISAPCAPAAAVLAALVGESIAGAPGAVSPERITVLLMLVALMSGLLQVAYGLVGGGKLIKYIPYPVVSGYLSGVGAIIFIGQLPKFLGLPAAVHLRTGITTPALWQSPAIIVGAVTIAGMVLAPRLTKAVPATILGLAAGLLAYFGLGLMHPELLQSVNNRQIIGPVGDVTALFTGLADHWSAIAALHFADWRSVAIPALTLSVLLSVDTLKTCVVMDTLTRSRHDSNRTLIGQGTGNLVSVFIGGMPGSGAMGPTLVNLESGGRTRFSGLCEGIFLLAVVLVLGRWIAWVPVAALAGILIVVAVRMFDWRSFRLLRQKSTILDFAVIATVVIVAVGDDLMTAAGAGVALSMLLFVREQIHGSVIRRMVTGARMFSTQHRLPEEQAVLERHGARITICELQGSLFFGTTEQLLTGLEPKLSQCRYLILDLRRVQSIDFTAAHLLERFEAELTEQGGYLLFSRLPARAKLRSYFSDVGVFDPRRNVRRFESLDDALQWAEDRILAAELPAPAGAELPFALAEFDLVSQFAASPVLDALAACITERSCAAGEAIFHSGEPGDELFLIRRGVVRIVLPLKDGGHHNLASFGRGNFFGEMSLLEHSFRSAAAVATTAVDLYVLSRARFDALSATHPQVAIKIYAQLARTLALRLRRADGELRAFYDS